MAMVRSRLRFLIFASCMTLAHMAMWAQGVDVTAKVVVRSPRSAGDPKKEAQASEVVVWLSPRQALASKPQPQSHGPYRLLQKDKQFSPHVLVVPTGTNVEFPNADPFFHNVFSLFNGKRFDLGLYESGTTRSVRFDREGVSYIFCNIHPEMGAVVLALSTPFYAVSGKNGEVVIHDVPPGTYQLQVWSERAKVLSPGKFPRDVQITTSATNLGEIEMETVASPLAGHKNKFGEDYKPTHESPY
jgi:plastocyanin